MVKSHQKRTLGFRVAACFTLLVLLASCGTKLQYLGQAVASDSKAQSLSVGEDVLKIFSIRTEAESSKTPITVFYVGGSGCTSLSVYLAPYFLGAVSGLEVFSLDKTGVSKGDLGLSCSVDFWNKYTYDEILRRNLLALEAIRTQRPDSQIMLVGTSEGGPIVIDMAAQAQDIVKVAVIGAGGMTQRKELELLFERRGGLPQFQAIAARIDADPNNTAAFELGYPHTYWSSVLDRDPSRSLKTLRMPVLLVIGANDDNVPVSSARFAHSILPNSRLIEWPNANHVFEAQTGNQRPAVLAAVTAFLTE